MFNLREVEQWLGLNIVEIWVNLVSLTVFSVLLTLKLDEVVLHIETPKDSNSLKLLLLSEETPERILYDLTWWQVFSPLFISDALNCYFCTIVWIRMYLEGANGKISRGVWSYLSILCLMSFKYMLCEQLEKPKYYKTRPISVVMSTFFLWMGLLMIRTCRIL